MKRQIIKEPKEIDFSMKSEPWTEKELADFRIIMQNIKDKDSKKKVKLSRVKKRTLETV